LIASAVRNTSYASSARPNSISVNALPVSAPKCTGCNAMAASRSTRASSYLPCKKDANAR